MPTVRLLVLMGLLLAGLAPAGVLAPTVAAGQARPVGSAMTQPTTAAQPTTPAPASPRPTPRPEPLAETKLLMEGLAAANLRGLAELLRDKPPDAEAWAFARGQALLIAETANLLLLRPPRQADARDAWGQHTEALRQTASTLARHAAAKNYARSRAALAALANACNRCHRAFGVGFRADPFLPP